MDFTVKGLKDFATEAVTAFSRAKQYTEEKLGSSERTELDSHFEQLSYNADKIKLWTEHIVSKTEAVLEPNPGSRVEDYLLVKLENKRKERTRNHEWLGGDLMDAGFHFGPGTIYGSALIKVGITQEKIGKAERNFVETSYKCFVLPLKKFLDEDVRNVMRERRILETKRLDLDAAKNRLRKARTMEAQQNAEEDLKRIQIEFDRQVEITKLLLEGLQSAHTNHVRYLSDFVEAQINYYSQCNEHMKDLQRELASVSSNKSQSNTMATTGATASVITHQTVDLTSPTEEINQLPNGKKRARVLYDYEARELSELSLHLNEVIIVSQSKDLPAEWMLGERGTQKGKVPLAYLEILS